MTTSKLPEHLHPAYEWINSAGEWDDALANPTQYAEDAAQNFIDHAEPNDPGFVTRLDIIEVIEWERERRAQRRA